MQILHSKAYTQLVTDVLTKAGLIHEQSKAAAEIMAYADERGIESHGLILLKTYVKRIEEGIIRKAPNYRWEMDNPNVALLDADGAMGHFAGKLAMEKAIEKADKQSIGLVLVKNTTHYGASGYYTELAAKHGMIGFSTTNTFPLMAPTGGVERILGNNPISISVPRGGEHPVILDMAASVVAAGKLVVATSKGETIPEGWAVDKNGEPTTDPYEGYLGGGTLLPLGDHKGYGLALVMDVLAGVLSGAGYGEKVDHSTIGNVMMAIDIESILPRQTFSKRVDDLFGMVQGSRKSAGVEKIYLPGEIEYEKQEVSRTNGFKVSESLYKDLGEVTKRFGLDVTRYFL